MGDSLTVGRGRHSSMLKGSATTQHLLTAILAFLHFSLYPCDAQIIRDRSVNCNSQEMEVTFEFAQPFGGIIYANNFYQSGTCRWEGDGSRRLVVPVPLTTNPSGNRPYCGVKVQENTGEFSVMLIVTPMKGLLVEGMTGLTVRCMYNIGDVTLTLPAGPNGAGILISPQTQTGIVTGSGGSPFLQMAIRDGHGISGEVINSASVGQRISLDVVMQDTAIYDFYVHGCYAHDGTNTPEASISIIDANGCAVRLSRAVDVPTFYTTPVSGGPKHVYVHLYGFQFTTSQLVYFECQVRPCLQTCPRPQCDAGTGGNGVRAKRASLLTGAGGRSRLSNIRNEREATSATAEDDSQLPSNYRLQAVLQIKPHNNDIIPVGRDDPLASTAEVSLLNSGRHVCVHTAAAVAILSIFALVCAASLIAAMCLCKRIAKDDDGSSSTTGSRRFFEGGNSCNLFGVASRSGAVTRCNYYSPTSTPTSQDVTYASSSPSRGPAINRRQQNAL